MSRTPDTKGRAPFMSRIKAELHPRLKAVAEERDVSMNYLINRAIEDYLDRLLPLADLERKRK